MTDLARFADDIESRCEAIETRLSVDAQRACSVAFALLSQGAPTLAEACEAEHVALVTAAGQLTAEGYSVGAIRSEEVAALYVIAAEMVLGRGEGAAHALLEAQALLGEAVFMLSRADVSGGTRAEADRLERARRAAAGEKGGRPPKLNDAAVAQFFVEWHRVGKPKRGSVKAAAANFDVTDKAIRGALKRMQTKPT